MFVQIGVDFQCLNQELDCENGGSCQVEKGRPVCVCPETFFGKTCQFQSSSTIHSNGTANMTGNPNGLKNSIH
jgi:hypothetical protein